MQPTLTLYHTPWCGYCHVVQRAADDLGVSLNLVNVADDEQALHHLIQKRGRRTVPVLGITRGPEEELLGESRDIMRYLKELAPAAG